MSTVRLSVDPGIRGCGLAIFVGGLLHRASYVPNTVRKGDDAEAVRAMSAALYEACVWQLGVFRADLQLERPQIYAAGKGKGDPNDLLPLEGIGAGFAGRLDSVEFLGEVGHYLPRDWKGTIDPEEISRRVRARLSDSEFGNVTTPDNTCAPCREHHSLKDCSKTTCMAHNIYDAIGIGLKKLGRFEPLKVIPR